MQEKNIEKRLRVEVKKAGGKAYKFSSPGNNGVPDRIVLFEGRCYFVELKRPGQNLSPRQRAVKKDFEAYGFPVYKIDSFDDVDEFVKEIVDEV